MVYFDPVGRDHRSGRQWRWPAGHEGTTGAEESEHAGASSLAARCGTSGRQRTDVDRGEAGSACEASPSRESRPDGRTRVGLSSPSRSWWWTWRYFSRSTCACLPACGDGRFCPLRSWSRNRRLAPHWSP